MKKLKCEICGKEIIDGQDNYYKSFGDIVFCESCGDERLGQSQYGYYDILDDMPDPDILLDDELSDVDFFEFKDKQ